jgi:hypothetical protein
LEQSSALSKAYLEQYCQVMTIWCPSRAWAKNIRSQAGAWERGKIPTELLKNYGGQGAPQEKQQPLDHQSCRLKADS